MMSTTRSSIKSSTAAAWARWLRTLMSAPALVERLGEGLQRGPRRADPPGRLRHRRDHVLTDESHRALDLGECLLSRADQCLRLALHLLDQRDDLKSGVAQRGKSGDRHQETDDEEDVYQSLADEEAPDNQAGHDQNRGHAPKDDLVDRLPPPCTRANYIIGSRLYCHAAQTALIHRTCTRRQRRLERAWSE